MLKLLIFDLDGTLADTSQDICDAINYAMKPFGKKTFSVEETKAMVGSGISKLLESLIPADSSLSSLKRYKYWGTNRERSDSSAKALVTDRFLDFYSKHLLDNTRAYPNVKKTLSRLNQYKKAVLSNKRKSYSERILKGLNLLQYFDLILGSDSVREKKPSPVPILDLLDRFDISKGEAAIVGDSNYDVEAGKAAGIKVIGATYGFRSRESLRAADFLIDRFDELLDVIPRLA